MDQYSGKFEENAGSYINIGQSDLHYNNSENVYPNSYEVTIIGNANYCIEDMLYVLTVIFHQEERVAVKSIATLQNGENVVCGEYTKDVAETKITHALGLLGYGECPLKMTMQRRRRVI